jgi:predicted dehydrogenase
MSSNRITCAVVGLGIGEQHAKTILDNTDCSLSTIVDLNTQKCNELIQKYSCHQVAISNYHDVLADEQINLVSIATFDDNHYEQVMLALQNNKHVFVEKPLCQTRDELKQIHKEWAARKCGLASNLVLRKSPLYMYLKELISEGALGEIYSFDADYLYGRIEKITEGWRKDVANYSVMEGGGIHMIDLLLWLVNAKPVSVSSQNNKIATNNTAFRYPDFQSSIFGFENGLIARITANFGCMHHHQHVVRIFGTKGTFIYDDMGARIHWSRSEDSKPEIIQRAPKPANKGELINEFVEALKSNNLQSLAQREFDLMSVVLSADDAINDSKPLKIEYI